MAQLSENIPTDVPPEALAHWGHRMPPLTPYNLRANQPTETMPISRSYRAKTASPLALHRRWIQQDMDLQDADTMRAYDRAQYYANEDGCHTGTDSDA